MNPAETIGGAQPPTLQLSELRQTDAAEVRCEQALRVVCGKRASYLGRWADRAVFVKLFFDKRSARRHWERERRGIEALAARELATPALLYAGPVWQPKGYALVTEALSPAETLADAWQRVNTPANHIALLECMGETLAAQHQAGILQQDPHLGNFLLSGGQLYSIDASKLRVRAQLLPTREGLANLALLLAQLEPRYDADAGAALRAYVRMRGWVTGEAEVSRLRALIDRARERRKRAFLKKIFRECTAYARRKTPAGVTVYDKHFASPGFEELYADPNRVFEDTAARYLKRGNTSTIVVTNVDGLDVVVKRYNIKSAWHGMKRALRRTRASISWEHAQLLRFYGVCTPRPIAFIEHRTGPAKRMSYYISEYVLGPNCREHFAGAPASGKAADRLAKKIAELLATLGRYRIRHGDMKATNIIIRDDQPYLTDLDAMREYPLDALFRRAHRDDLRRFLQNWPAGSPVRNLFAKHLEVVARHRIPPATVRHGRSHPNYRS